MSKTLVRWPICFAALVTSQTAFAQDVGSSTRPPCPPTDIPCQIIRMSPKPGGGGGGGITNGERPEVEIDQLKMDLGVERVPSEQMRLPELKQLQMDAAPAQ